MDSCWTVVGQLLVGRWLIIELRESQIFLLFGSIAVGVRPRRWVISKKQYLCRGTARLISDLDKMGAAANAIGGRPSLLG